MGWAVVAIVFSSLAQLVETSVAFIFQHVVDNATRFSVGEVAYGAVIFWVAAYPTSVLLNQILWRSSGFTGMRWLTGFRMTAQMTLFSYLTSQSHAYFSSRFTGAIVSKIRNAENGIASILESLLWNYLPTLLSFILSAVFAWIASPLLAGAFLFWIIAIIPVNVILARRVSRLSLAEAEQGSRLRGVIADIFSNIAAVQQYARRKAEDVLVWKETDFWRRAALKNWTASEYQLLFNNVVFVGGFILTIVGLSFWLWHQGSITLGEFIMALTLANSLTGSLTFVGMSMKSFAEQYGNASEGLSAILIPQDVTDFPKAKPLTVEEGEIVLDKVGFSYGTRPVFKDFSLVIPPGERVGIVGPSGSGKTTLISLLLRQYDVHEGEIRIDGQNIRKVTLDSLRSNVAVVPQDPSLFHRPIRENIRYGREGASDQEVEEAAAKAEAHGFILDLPDGYSTMVGERGVKLSGGQRQRVAIARAILKAAPILVLDEATSSLDSESEAAIQQALAELMKGKTVIAVAHRLSTIRAMDRIIVMDAGRIIEEGSHTELLAKEGGLYARLWAHQAGGFLSDD